MALTDYFNNWYWRDSVHLLLWTLLPIAVSVLLYVWEGRSAFVKKRPLLFKILCGVIFGGIAVLNTEFGMDIGGAIINVRDAAPLCAGFIFGPVSGIIAGVIGGVERWLSVYWNFTDLTRVACSVSTAFAGVYAAFLRKYFYDGKRPGPVMGFVVAALMEILHMMAVYFTHMDNPVDILQVIRACTIPMTLLNAVAVMGAILSVDGADKLIKRLSGGARPADAETAGHSITLRERMAKQRISQQVQIRLFFAVTVAFCVSAAFFYIIQNNTVLTNTQKTLMQGMYSLLFDINDESDTNALRIAHNVARELEKNPDADLETMCTRFNVADIYVIDSNGIIVRTSGDYLGFDMHADSNLPDYEQQAGAFLALLDEDGPTEMVQPFQPIAADSGVERKFAGVRLSNGGFMQIGLDAAMVESELDNQVKLLTYNRVVGESGYYLVADSTFKLISDDFTVDGHYINDIIPELDIWAAQEEMARVNREGTEYYCMTCYVEGIVIVALLPTTDVDATRDTSIYFNFFLQIIVYALLFLVIYFVMRTTVVSKLKHVNTRLEAIIGGDLDTVVDVRSSEEFALLSDDINSTVHTLKTYIAEAESRIDRELAFARQIQQAALPSVFPPYPGRKEFSLYAIMQAAKEVGGDFYDFFLTGEDKLAVLVADVSGKGIPAAMFMMNAKTTIKNLAERGLPVNEVLTGANERLCANNETGMFVTAWIGIIDLVTGHVSFANAGHNPPYVIRNDAGVTMLKSRPGFVLGGIEGTRYKEQGFDLKPGERLFLYTDGVTEAVNPAMELFGEKRLEGALQAYRRVSAEELLPSVRAEVSAFAELAEQADDITMLIFDWHGQSSALTVAATTEQADRIGAFLTEQLEAAGAKPKATTQILVAADEIVSNIIKFAYPAESGNITVTAHAEDTAFCVTFSDDGVAFNPLDQPEPDTTLPAEQRTVGGLGIFIVKKTMDEVLYERKGERNVLTLRKDIRA